MNSLINEIVKIEWALDKDGNKTYALGICAAVDTEYVGVYLNTIIKQIIPGYTQFIEVPINKVVGKASKEDIENFKKLCQQKYKEKI